jgi:hypothetical protein
LLNQILTINSGSSLAAASNSTGTSAASPNPSRLQQVVLVGFSAGGQTVHRYAWATSYGSPPPPTVSSSSSGSRGISSSSSSSSSGGGGEGGGGPRVKFVVADPGSYLYFDAKRPAPSCRPLNDTGPKWRCKQFVTDTLATAGCPAYNTYKLGTEGVLQAIPYFAQQRPGVTPNQLSAAYLGKDILYLLGEADTCNCGTKGYQNPQQCLRPPAAPSKGCKPSVAGPQCCDAPAPSRTNNLAVDCAAMLQVSSGLGGGG